MKNVYIMVSFLALASCSKPTEEIVEVIVEKEVEVAPRPTTEMVVNYYFEPIAPIVLEKSPEENFLSIHENKGIIFLLAETTNGVLKNYSLRKFDVQTKTTTKVIDNLSEVKSISFSDRYIFISQNNAVQAYDINSFKLALTIGLGNAENFRMEKVMALTTTDRYLVVRDVKRIRFYNLSDIIPENDKKVPVIVKSADYTADEAIITIFDNVLHFKRIQNGNKRYQLYTLNSEGLITENQVANERRDISDGVVPTIVSFTQYNNDFYAVFDNGSLGIVNPTTLQMGKHYTEYQGQPLNAQSMVVVDGVLYAMNRTDNKIFVFERKNLIYREY